MVPSQIKGRHAGKKMGGTISGRIGLHERVLPSREEMTRDLVWNSRGIWKLQNSFSLNADSRIQAENRRDQGSSIFDAGTTRGSST